VYTWWVFLHLVGVFGFLAAHGVSIGVLFKLRSERDPAKIAAYLQLSGASTRVFYYSLGLLVVAGTVAGFLGHWWGQAWIWTAIAVLVVTTLAMYYMAKPYYRRVDRIAKSKAGGSEAVTDEQFDEVLKDRRPVTIAAIGVVGLLAILYLMVLKPQFGLAGSAAPPPGSASCTPNGTQLSISAQNVAFDTDCLAAPAGRAVTVAFDNKDPGIPHNFAVYTNSSGATAVATGDIINGPSSETVEVKALPAGTYYFRCDVHSQQMNGSFVVT